MGFDSLVVAEKQMAAFAAVEWVAVEQSGTVEHDIRFLHVLLEGIAFLSWNVDQAL